MNILLDSCTFIRMTADPAGLSENARNAVLNPDNTLFMSIVSVWELCLKHEKDQSLLAQPPEIFFPKHCKYFEIAILPLAEKAIYALPNLPKHHRDPFDRLLICQALAHDLTILTPDENFRKYDVAIAW